jgi:PTH1 family peptidyl-tRNA hydrolase
VAHDDLDIPLGKFKISFGKGPLVHNGLLSIYQQLGTKEFWHIRIGIDADRDGQTPEEFVLTNFSPGEKKTIAEVFKQIINELKHAKS